MTKIIEIIPAIMPDRYSDIENMVGMVKNRVPLVQLDIMDGVFVPEKTWPFLTGFLDDPDMRNLLDETEGLPLWEDMDYELDLMIQHPEKTIHHWIQLGPKRIILHLESIEPDQVVPLLQGLQGIRPFIEIGLSIGNDTSMSDLEPHLEVIDCVQFMGIGRIGYQGEAFDERVIEKIATLRAIDPHLPIHIDGSVNRDTIEILRDAGAQRFIVGSAVFGEGIPESNIEELWDMIQ